MEESDSGVEETAEIAVVCGGDGSENREGRTHGESGVIDTGRVGIYITRRCE